jgi:radical SAM protein with 4Fe4S-binding SPASM domain
MRIEGRRYRDEWLPNFYPSKKIGDRYIRISRTGKSQILTAEEDAQIGEFFMEAELFARLERTGHIITAQNSQKIFADLKEWQKHTYSGPQLHIVVATKRCNLDCTYCHMNPESTGADKNHFDLQPEVAEAIIRFALGTPNPRINFEFQGGEAFLNFPGMVHFVETARRLNQQVGKDIYFSAVSNLMVATDEQLAYCLDNGILVSYSLNGPQPMHDLFRINRKGRGSYDIVMRRVAHINQKFPGLLTSSPLCVVTADNAGQLREMLDFYHNLGFRSPAILKLNNLGNAVRHNIQFDAKEFIKYYIDALDYVYEKNKPLRDSYSERMATLALLKIVSDVDVPFVDWRNPIGDVNGVLIYDYDGEILPADEARSLREVFSLGNVLTTTYDEMIRRKETFWTMNLSLRDNDPTCRECAYNPYCGVSPVLSYAKTGDPVPRPHEADNCVILMAVLDWVFQKLQEDPLPLVHMIPEFESHFTTLTMKAEKAETAQSY